LLVVGLSRPRPDLYARVDARIDAMIAAGLEGEVRALLAAGHGWQLPALSSVGYGEWRGHFDGQVDRDEVVRLIRHNTRRLVRNQGAWFRPDDPGITWVDLDQPDAEGMVWALARGWFGATPTAADRPAAPAATLPRGEGPSGVAIMAGDDPRTD
jgi:tRNA dimethylallyltransferase